MPRIVSATLVLFMLLIACGSSFAGGWLVTKVSGSVSAGAAGHLLEVKRGVTIALGSTVSTSANGRVQLERDNSSMIVAPNTTVVLEKGGFFGRKTRVAQEAGSVAFDIEKRSKPYFSINTPYLAAVVKGTRFTINVGAGKSRVNVSRGLVQVTGKQGGQSVDVGAGQWASASANTKGVQASSGVKPSGSVGSASSSSLGNGKPVETKAKDAGKDKKGEAKDKGHDATGHDSKSKGGESKGHESKGGEGKGHESKGHESKGGEGKGGGKK